MTPQVSAIQESIRSTVSSREWVALERTLEKIASGMQDEESKAISNA